MSTILEISNLYKTYSNGKQALKGIDLNVQKGDFFALLGPNGAGKSTTIGVLSSLINKTSGKVKILGHDLDANAYEAKRKIGIVPQEFNFDQFDKVQNILLTQAGYYGLTQSEAETKAEQYLKQLGLWDKRNGIARDLSGGMKRRLMIARALIHSPELLILDEPTAGVDIELRRSMWDFLRYLNNELNITIILTTHYLEEAEQLCRSIAIIDHGKIIECSSMNALLAQLQTETFVFYAQDPLQTDFCLPDYLTKQETSHSFLATIHKGQSLSSLFQELTDQKIKVVSMRNHINRLEELFVQKINTNKANAL